MSLSTAEIRESFLEFFREREHRILPSASLIPEGDPTLLFTSAGMVPFKPYYLEGANPPSRRVATVQKCLRAGGKDSDLELVGETGRHHSFFEMLGNFSFGDYFKEEAIRWGWEYVTSILRFPPDQLWVSIYEDDDEAASIWQREAGLPAERIMRLGEKDNFWGPAGDTGVCGPCSEIYVDRGSDRGCRRAACAPGCGCDRFVEFWNLVFPQFYQDETGHRRRLATPGVDTGMGLERVASLSQGAEDNFHTDVFRPLIDFLGERLAADGAGEKVSLRAERLIADHARALAFAVAEGILPSNEGRGYVLRRILRRAVREGHRQGLREPFLFEVAGVVVDVMGGHYQELRAHREQIALALKGEEERFFRTLEQGETLFAESLGRARESGERLIPGEVVFRLYDTYGFPPELTREMAGEEGYRVDEEGFAREMASQRERARGRSGFRERAQEIETAHGAEHTPFAGYEMRETGARVIEVRPAGEGEAPPGPGGEVELLLDRTPFYAEEGGQVGDTGEIRGTDWAVEVRDTFREPGGAAVHRGVITRGEPRPGDQALAAVDEERRAAVMRNHTATHLLQAALREVLGTHLRQNGSLVAPDRLRFDFSHYAPLTASERRAVEERVNRDIRADLPVLTERTSYQEARGRGALAFFGEKYGDEVRLVTTGERSLELCGGTHVGSTGEIGLFLLVSESGVAAGVRRIEAVTGEGALALARRREEVLEEAAGLLRAPWEEIPARLSRLLEENRRKGRELERLRGTSRRGRVVSLAASARRVGDVRVVTAALGREVDRQELRRMVDELREELGRGVVVLGVALEGRVALAAGLTSDLVKDGRLHAGRLVGEVARSVGGGGGGRPDFAEAGGKDPAGLEKALDEVSHLVAEALGLS